MEMLFVLIPIGVFLSLISFFYFETRAIKANKATAIVTGEIPVYNIDDKLKHYDTINNTGYFAIVVFVFTLLLSMNFYHPTYGLIHALMYIFLTTIIGSVVIFSIKIKRSLLVKVFAAFLYGIAHMIGASLAFLGSYIVT